MRCSIMVNNGLMQLRCRRTSPTVTTTTTKTTTTMNGLFHHQRFIRQRHDKNGSNQLQPTPKARVKVRVRVIVGLQFSYICCIYHARCLPCNSIPSENLGWRLQPIDQRHTSDTTDYAVDSSLEHVLRCSPQSTSYYIQYNTIPVRRRVRQQTSLQRE